MAKFLLMAFVIIPVSEFTIFYYVGGMIGLLPTLGLILLTAMIGVNLFRHQGMGTWAKIQHMLNQGQLPAVEAIEGVMLLIAGALLLTPGFLTDVIGFSILVPPLRRIVAQFVLAKGIVHANVNVAGAGRAQAGQASSDDAIEGEFHREN